MGTRAATAHDTDTRPAGAPAEPPEGRPAWHARSGEAAARALGCDPRRGLSAALVAERRRVHGPNALREPPPRGLLATIVRQLADVMLLVLIAAAVVSGIIGEPSDAAALLVVVVLATILGVAQERKAERAVAALRRLSASTARVVRDGAPQRIASRDLVPGDLVVLEAGDLAPADARLLEAAALQAQEATLTGESAPVDKDTPPLGAVDLPLGDRLNMLFKGTLITRGRARAVVVATGMETELGRIATLLEVQRPAPTPLQRRLARFGRRLTLAILVICAVVVAVGLAGGGDPMQVFLTGVTLAVAAIPEGLPAVVTIGLALGARKMAQRNALVRRLSAVESLGSVTTICADKTGTLTLNAMRVEVAPSGPRSGPLARRIMAACNDARLTADGEGVGDPMEVALLLAAGEAGPRPARLAELPFDAERKRMTTVVRDDAGVVAYTKGAPETVVPLTVARLAEGEAGAAPLDRPALLAEAAALAAQGLRVLALARRRLDGPPPEATVEALERDLTFVGFVGLLDPPRPEVLDAVAQCRSAGITPVMITGDHPDTAAAIARRLGIERVHARTDPSRKVDIVEALQARGEVVAMTGDGVNDAPALKRAEIGVAMGGKGTEVAREAADLVLLDDNFATIVAAVQEGRRIFDNIRKFLKYSMASNAGEILTLLLAPLFGMPVPLLPIHILWINMAGDGLPGIALVVEPREPGLMQRPPRPLTEGLFAHGLWQHMLWVGVLMGAASLAAGLWARGEGSAHWQSVVLTALVVSQMGHVMVVRSDTVPLWRLGLTSNRPMLGAVALTLALQGLLLYVPWLGRLFHTGPLTGLELAVCALPCAALMVGVEIEKWLVRRGWIYRSARATGIPNRPA